MNTARPLLALTAMAALTALAILGCESPRHPGAADVEQGVRALLDRWLRAFESRDAQAVRSVLAGDDRFIWLEDGEARYKSSGDVVLALAAFPPGLTFSHTIDSARIVPISDDAAWAHLAVTTRIRQGERTVSEFGGVVLMLVERAPAGWRIVAAHTSTTKPRAASPG
jgi:ketosteroid isomerase-like protein